MVNNVIGVVNYVIAARPSLLNFVIADKSSVRAVDHLQTRMVRGLRCRID